MEETLTADKTKKKKQKVIIEKQFSEIQTKTKTESIVSHLFLLLSTFTWSFTHSHAYNFCRSEQFWEPTSWSVFQFNQIYSVENNYSSDRNFKNRDFPGGQLSQWSVCCYLTVPLYAAAPITNYSSWMRVSYMWTPLACLPIIRDSSNVLRPSNCPTSVFQLLAKSTVYSDDKNVFKRTFHSTSSSGIEAVIAKVDLQFDEWADQNENVFLTPLLFTHLSINSEKFRK